MKLSTEFNYGSILFGTERAIKLMADCGFDALDYSMFDLTREDNPLTHDDWRERMRSFRAIAEENGLCFNQTHAPFPSFKVGDEQYNATTYPQLIRAIEVTAILGAKYVVMHPQPTGGDDVEKNAAFFSSLAPYCRQFGVKIAIENLIADSFFAKPEQLSALVDALDGDCFTALLDIGHASINGVGAPQFIKGLGGRLSALHVHDNDTIRDCHNLPFTKGLDWEAICTALAESGYAGDFTFEAGFFVRQFPKELAEQAYHMMGAVGRYLVNRIEAIRSNL